MSLRLICGRAGTGKSDFCLEEVKEKINDNKKIYIITPEQFSFTEEKKLLDKTKGKSVINAEVLTFARMAYRLLSEVGGATKINLSKSGKSMIIYDIIDRKKKELSFLGKSNENVELIDSILTELKKHRVNIQDLEDVKSDIDNPYLEKKIDDIITIYSEYSNLLKGKFIEENDKLEILIDQLDKTDVFKNCVFYIDEFTGFTKQEYEIIKKLMKIADSVTITITTDNLDMGDGLTRDIFYSNKDTASKLLFIAKENNIECDKTIFLNTSYRFENEELDFLERNITNNIVKPYIGNLENIFIMLAQNPYNEVENVAKEIVNLVKNGYRYKDIVVISKQLDLYGSLCKAIFNTYNIPIFIDEKKKLNQNLFAKYILALLEIYSSGWSYESVIQYLKSGFLEIEDEWIYEIENYAKKYGIKGSKWYKENWALDEDEKLEYINKIRKEKLEPLVKLKEIFSENKTVDAMNKALYQFLIDNKIDVILNEKQKVFEENNKVELAKEQELAWNIFIEILDEMNLIFKDKKISFTNYRELLKIALVENGLGIIPQTQDQVIIGDIERTKIDEVNAIFVLGVNDGVYPSVRKDEGFINDSERKKFKEKNIELAKGTLENLYEEELLIYKTFSSAKQKIYISYCSSDNEGKALRPSIYITKFKKMFPKLEEKSDLDDGNLNIISEINTFNQLINELRKENEGELIDPLWHKIEEYYEEKTEWSSKLNQAKKALYYKEKPENINSKNINKLYGNTLETSVSKLEQYQKCAFSYYLKYGLKLKEQEEYKIKSIDTGTFMHETIDLFFHKIREENIDIHEIDDKEIIDIIEKIVNEKLGLSKYYIFTSSPKFEILTRKLKDVLFQSMKYLIDGLKYSDFNILANELEFKKGKEYKPIILDLEDGKKVEITGKIDRIDIAKVGTNNYIRIIDYKSSVKNIDLNELVAGIQIQLITYLDAVCKIENMIPAGMLYYNLIDPIIKTDKLVSKEKIEDELKKQFKMNGLILADVNIIKMMDKKLENGASKVIPAYIDSKGNISDSKSNVVNNEQFKNLMKHTNKIIKEISKEILNGNIDINPYYQRKTKKTACDFCEYSSICNFKDSNLPYKYIENNAKEEILNNLKNNN